jgi:hypothetical protein
MPARQVPRRIAKSLLLGCGRRLRRRKSRFGERSASGDASYADFAVALVRSRTEQPLGNAAPGNFQLRRFWRRRTASVWQTDGVSPPLHLAEVASSLTNKAEPFLTEVITTSAPKQAPVRALGCPHPCLKIHVPNCVRWHHPGLAKASLNSHRPDTSARFPVHIETRFGSVHLCVG